jgi:HEPN domain-containing protein
MDNDILNPDMWIQYAQDDYNAAVCLAKAYNPHIPRTVCFLCQQSVEMILKAYLIVKNGTRPKEHDHSLLLQECRRHSDDFDGFIVACSTLKTYITATRYPSNKSITKSDMEQALSDTHKILEFTKIKLKELGYDFQPDTQHIPAGDER